MNETLDIQSEHDLTESRTAPTTEPRIQAPGFRIHGDPAPLLQALAAAQCEYAELQKTGYNKHKDYRYAKLEDLLRAVKPALSDHGLTILQTINDDEDGDPVLRTILGHESGAMVESIVSIPDVKLHGDSSGGVQAFGSAITYMRRYAVQSLVGVSGETDDDGAAADAEFETASEAQARKTGRETGGRPTAEEWVFTPETDLTEAHEERLENLGWERDGDDAWTIELTPEQAVQHKTMLGNLGNVSKGGD